MKAIGIAIPVAIAAVAVALAGCPTPPGPGGEGEGEGEGEGQGGEGEGEGEGQPPSGTNIVPGAGGILEDAAKDGSELAYRDANNTLFSVSPDGGAPAQVVINTDKAAYHGTFLIALHGDVNGDGSVYATADKRPAGGAVAALAANLRTRSLKATDDGLHLYHEVQIAAGVEDLFLDGARIVQNAAKEKIRFSPANDFLVVGANDGNGHEVVTFPVGGGAGHIIVGDLASNETQVTRNGAQLIYGANEAVNRCDITIAAMDGSDAPGTVLRVGGDDSSFKVTADNSEVVYIVDSAISGAIEAVLRTGGAPRIIRAGGASKAFDLKSISLDHIVYSTTVPDPLTGLETLRIIKLDGSGGDAALGANAQSDGFTADGAYLLYEDNVVSGLGSLHAFNVTNATIDDLGDGVKKVQQASASVVVFLDQLGRLHETTLGGATIIVADGVDHFALVHDGPPVGGVTTDSSRVAFSRPADGIWVAGL